MHKIDTTSVVDEYVVGRLRTLGGDEFVTEALGLFLVTARRLITEANNGLEEGDFHAILRSCHTMRGSAGNVGAAKVYGMSGEAEKAGKAGDLHDARRLMTQLHAALEEFEADIRTRGWI